MAFELAAVVIRMIDPEANPAMTTLVPTASDAAAPTDLLRFRPNRPARRSDGAGLRELPVPERR